MQREIYANKHHRETHDCVFLRGHIGTRVEKNERMHSNMTRVALPAEGRDGGNWGELCHSCVPASRVK